MKTLLFLLAMSPLNELPQEELNTFVRGYPFSMSVCISVEIGEIEDYGHEKNFSYKNTNDKFIIKKNDGSYSVECNVTHRVEKIGDEVYKNKHTEMDYLNTEKGS
jgi:hypothetical protein